MYLKRQLQAFEPVLVGLAIYLGNDLEDNDPLTNHSMIGLKGYERNWIPFFDNGEVVYGSQAISRLLLFAQRFQSYHLLAKALDTFGASKDIDGLMEIIEAVRTHLTRKNVELFVVLIPHDALVRDE